MLRLFLLTLLYTLTLIAAQIMMQRATAATNLIPVTLVPGSERRISFPVPVQVGLTAGTPISAEVRAEHLWLRSERLDERKPRLLVRSLQDSRQWVLELSTEPQDAAPLPPVFIEPRPDARPDEPHQRYVELVRWGYQQLYSPQRLLKPLDFTRPFPIPAAPAHLSRCRPRPSPLCPWLRTRMVAAWRQSLPTGQARYLSAVELTNLDEHPLPLSPDWLRGRWAAVSFSSSELAPHGDPTGADSAVALLVSSQPFEQALRR